MKASFAALAVVAIGSLSFPAHAACTQVSGTAEALDMVCNESPLLLCIDGTTTGDLAGTYHAAFQSLNLAPTLFEPLRFEIELESVITTGTGTISFQETGWLVLNDVTGAAGCLTGCLLSQTIDVCLTDCVMEYGRTELGQEMEPYAGTGAYAAIDSGWIDASGYGEYTTGISFLDYEGEICD
jgi:hypothetical protein